MVKKKDDCNPILIFLFVLMGGIFLPHTIQAQSKTRIYGTVYEADGKKQVPLDFATVSFPDFGMGTTTSNGGKYSLNNVPVGKVKIRVQYVGKHIVDTIVNLRGEQRFDFVLKNEDFRLQEIMVTAKHNAAGQSTSSNISRAAMEHLQATNLSDLLALMPGNLMENQNLTNAKTLNIRQIYEGEGSSLNALGTAIIRDGAPISNNANLSAMTPTLAGATGAIAGGASPSSGFDVRSISTENIENVEIIRGIPSVEYGDLTSGAVIIHSKAGREPLRIKAKANPNVYQGSVSTGLQLGKKSGALNMSFDYAHNTNKPIESYDHYQRAAGKLLYSNSLFSNQLRTNTSLDFFYGKDENEQNPDDDIDMRRHRSEDVGFTLNTNGVWSIKKGWLDNIRYVLSGSYTSKRALYQELYTSANASYSMTTTDGATLSNHVGSHVTDATGKEITKFGAADQQNYAYYLPSTYLGVYHIDSREVNLFGKLTANFFKQFNHVNNRILLGVDFKADGNEGDGKTFAPTTPPFRNLSYSNSTFRPRAYSDIPYIKHFGAFAEEGFNWQIGSRALNIVAGLRYDNVSVAGGVVSPRINASFEIIPEVLTIRGGYGVTAKMPTLLYLYPEPAYFEYIHINEVANENLPESERQLITTTKVYNADNPDLKIAKNYKSELGFDLHIGKVDLAVTGFIENVKDGYNLGRSFDTYKKFVWDTYGRNADGLLELTGSYPVLSAYSSPNNNLFVKTKGIEFEMNIPRIEAIRTAFQLSGSWMESVNYSDSYSFYDNSGTAADVRKDIAIYDKHGFERHERQFVTTLRAIHNIPSIGFVVTLTGQAVWNMSDWIDYLNYDLPVGYMSLEDGKPHMFNGQYKNEEQFKEAGLGYLLRNVSKSGEIKESWNPFFCFNINLTKEIGDLLRVSFFANNMFRMYPRQEYKRSPGSYKTDLNNRHYFGVELGVKI